MKRKKEKSLGSLETLCSRNLVLHVQFVFFLSKMFHLFQNNFFLKQKKLENFSDKIIQQIQRIKII